MNRKTTITVILTIIIFSGFSQRPVSFRHAGENPGNISETEYQAVDKEFSLSWLNGQMPFSKKELIWKWDTIIVYDTTGVESRWTQILDLKGNTIVQKIERWTDNGWENDRRDTCGYYPDGKIKYELDEFWLGNNWDSLTLWRHFYDESGHKLSDTVETWVGGITWANFAYIDYVTDQNGNVLTLRCKTFWETEFKNSYRRSYTYDSDGKLLTLTEEDWISEQWINSLRYTWDYDEYNRKISHTCEYWQKNGWINTYKVTFAYDDDGYSMTMIYYSWENNGWVQTQKICFTADPSGNILSILFMLRQNNSWINSFLLTYSNDSYGNCISAKCERWKDGSWYPSMGALDFYYYKAMSFAINGHRYEAHYTSLMNIENVNGGKTDLKIFPNPAVEQVYVEFDKNISGADVEVFDLNGKIQFRTKVLPFLNRINIDVSTWRKGIYLVKIICKEKNPEFGKIVVTAGSVFE